MDEEKRPSPVWEALSRLLDLLLAGLLWLVCCLPVLTAGAATTALYYAVVKCVRHERGRLVPSFFAAFKQNFRMSTLCWLVLLLWLALGAVNTYAVGQLGLPSGSVLTYASRLFFVPAALVFPWLFAYISRYENSFAGTWKLAGYLCIRHLGATLLLLGELLLFAAIVYFIPLLLPLLPGAFCLLMSLRIEPALKLLLPRAEDSNTDRWYEE